MKSVSHYRGRLLIAAVVLIVGLVGGITMYRLTQGDSPTRSYGEGPASLPTLNGLTHDTYTQVAAHPERYQGDEILWPCKVEGFYGTDSGGNTGIACNVYNPTDRFQKSQGALIILAAPDVDVSMVRKGDDITLDGYVDEPYTGRDRQGNQYSQPEISATIITDHGPPTTSTSGGAPTG